MASVAILGVGKMGAAMARELASAGHQVLLWNRTIERALLVSEAIDNPQVSVATTIAEAISGSDFALSLFSNGEITESMLLSDPAIVANSPSDYVFVDMGTSGINVAHSLAGRICAAGRRFVDAPVSGSMATIASHQLLVLASGDESAVELIRPALLSFSKKVSYLGKAGAGQAMKLSINLVVHSLNAALAQALALATSSGIDPALAYDLFEESVIAAPFVKYKRSAFLDASTPVAMRIDTTVKDLGLIFDFARSKEIDSEAIAALQNLYIHACDGGFADQDMASLVRFLQKE
ncbi:MAG: NAD(P)-dependent oxidoreductase [Actinomycetes bacterium]